MRIIHESNLNEILGKEGAKASLSQNGEERTESIKTHFLGLGEITSIHRIVGESRGLAPGWLTVTRMLNEQLPVRTYTLEVSVWKVVALVALLPIFCVQRIFGAAGSLFTRDVTVSQVKIEASRDAEGKVSMNTTPKVELILREKASA